MRSSPDEDAALPPLGPLAAWAGRLAPGTPFGNWKGGETDAEGVTSWPWVDYDPLVTTFVEEAYARGWVLSGFNWSEWIGREEVQSLAEVDAIERATAADLFRLVTVIIRQDHFSEGSLLEALQNGMLDAITRRAAVLASG